MEKSDQQPEPTPAGSTQCTVQDMRNLHRIVVNTIEGYQEREFDQDPMRPSRLLGLPAELRNRIYELLLDTGNVDTASPRILDTCKQIHEEASSVLYGSNTFKIVISRTGVEAQGVRSGTYAPGHNREIVKLEWPVFLCKAQQVEVTVEDLGDVLSKLVERAHAVEHGCRWKHGGRLAIVNNVLFSLCLFLGASGMQRSLILDIRGADTPGNEMWYSEEEECDCFAQSVGPLNILFKHRTVKLEIWRTDPSSRDEAVTTVREIPGNSWPDNAISCLAKWRSLTKKARLYLELHDAVGEALPLPAARDPLAALGSAFVLWLHTQGSRHGQSLLHQ